MLLWGGMWDLGTSVLIRTTSYQAPGLGELQEGSKHGGHELSSLVIYIEIVPSYIGAASRMSTTLTNLKSICGEFKTDEYGSSNTDRKWKAYIENFESCLEFEDVKRWDEEKVCFAGSWWC